MKKPCISIIVPIYNIQQYVGTCIKSIINQSYKNLQIILVDDGSTDFSGRICDSYKLIDNRIEVIHQKNLGLVEARKSGLRMARGEYIGFVDGDDYIDENMYECLFKYILKEDADMVHTGYFCSNENEISSKVDFNTEFISLEQHRKKLINDILNYDVNIEPSIWSKLFKRELILKAYDLVHFDCSYGEDLVCFIASIFLAKKIYIINDAYYYYRIRITSLSHDMGICGIGKEVTLYNNIKFILKRFNAYNEYKETLDFYFGKNIIKQMKKNSTNPFLYETYYFGQPQLVQNKRIVLYGAGNVGRDYYSQFSRYTNCDIVAWIDKNADKIKIPYIKVLTPEVIKDMEFDYIIIAVLEKKIVESIMITLSEIKVNKNKIIWFYPQMYKK
jgi:glycosyltransferase involved in cell wall biosynthesis